MAPTGIQPRLTRSHGDLGAAAGLAGDGLDLDRAGVHLGHFQFEETAQEALVGPADVDLRALGAPANLEHEGLDVLADPVVLERRLLRGGQDRLGLAHVQDDGSRLDARNRTGDQFVLTAGVAVEDDVALRLVEALADDLHGGLRVDTAECLLIELLGFDELADLRVGLDGLSVRECDLRGGIVDLLDDQARAKHTHVAGIGIHLDVDVLVAGLAAVGGFDRLFDGSNQLLSWNALFRRSAAGARRRNLDPFAPPVRLCRSPSTAADFVGKASGRLVACPFRPLKERRGGHPRQSGR